MLPESKPGSEPGDATPRPGANVGEPPARHGRVSAGPREEGGGHLGLTGESSSAVPGARTPSAAPKKPRRRPGCAQS